MVEILFTKGNGEHEMSKKRILFIGDSITAAGVESDQERIGNGYVRIIHDYLMTTYPGQFEIINKGISGNRVTDLEARWENDVIRLKPDIISISIGINDVWRQLDSPLIEQIYPEKFERIYERLLNRTREENNSTILLMEPTIIEEDAASEGNEKLKAYIEVIHRLANKFGAGLILTHRAFIDYIEDDGGDELTTDGVHMTSAGNKLMAETWIKSTEELLVSKINGKL